MKFQKYLNPVKINVMKLIQKCIHLFRKYFYKCSQTKEHHYSACKQTLNSKKVEKDSFRSRIDREFHIEDWGS